MSHELPPFIGLIWSFQIHFHVVQWTRARGSGIYFRIDIPWGLGWTVCSYAMAQSLFLEGVPSLGRSNTSTPVCHLGLEIHCSLVSYFCFGWWTFLEIGDSIGSRLTQVSTLGRTSQKSRGFILKGVLLMLFQRWSMPVHSVELTALGTSQAPTHLGLLLVLSFCKKHKYHLLL